jgi:type VI protein secretion system component VasK
VTLDDAVARRDRASRMLRAATFVLAALTLVLVVFMVLNNYAQNARLAEAVAQAKQAAQGIQDCTTPHGKCYERGRTQTAAAVQQIINALNTLESQRATTSAALNQSHDDIQAALRQLCDAQGLACPSLR